MRLPPRVAGTYLPCGTGSLVFSLILFPVELHELEETLHRGDGLVVILREVYAEAVQELRAELCAGRYCDVRVRARYADELVQRDLELGYRDEEVAAAVGRARGDAGDFFDDCHDVVADALVLGDARGEPAFRLAEPAAEYGLVVAAAAQRHDGLELLHAVDYLRGAEGRAEAVAAEGFGLGGADYRDEVLGDFALRAEVRVFDARVDLARVELVDDERSAVLLRERGYFEDFVARVDAAGGVVRVGEEEELDAALEGLFERREVYAGALFLVLVVHEDGYELAAEELGHLAVSEVVRLDYRDLVAGHDVRAHREEERALRAGREDEVFRRVYLRAGEGGELRRDVLEDFLSAAVGRVGLRAALFDALREELEAAGGRQVRVYVAVAEVDGLAFELRPAQVERGVFLQTFLSRSVVYAEGAEFFDYVQGERLL